MIGKVFGNRYELIEKVGTGGMSVVYKAKCRLLNRYVAVKVLKEEFISDEAFLKKFSQEAQSAAGLSHPNIVNIFDVGKEDHIPYIVMEYVAGDSLKAYIAKRSGFLTNDQIANFSRQIALALEHAHTNHIIHRDIKPHNIMVTADGTLKVADFGIASAVSETTTSYTGEAVGSIKYTSPEQARGRHVDQRTDLYSLGILMYEMATRQVPFQGETAVEIALKHMRDDVTPPGMINTTFHKGLESIVMRSLLKDISQRYQTARELIDDLEKIINNPTENVAFYDFDSDAPTQKIPSLKEFDLVEEGETRKMKKTTKKTSKNTSKKKSKLNWQTILPLVGVVLLAFVMVAVVFITTKLGDKPKEVAVQDIILPDVVHMTYEEGKKALEDLGLKAVEGTPESSDEVVKGSIASQSPSPGTKLRAGYPVRISISLGPDITTIPDFTSQTLTKAKIDIERSGFEVGEVTHVNDDLVKGYVVSQSPDPGAEVAGVTKISLVVSLGPEYNQVVMPKIIDDTVQEAQQKMIELGLEVGSITYANHETIEKDKIISQSVSPSKEVEIGSLVDIVVSLGPEEVPEEVPDEVRPVTKGYNIPAADFIGQTINVKVIYEQDGLFETIYNQDHEVTEEVPAVQIRVSGLGSGVLNIYFNGEEQGSYNVTFTEEVE